MVEVNDIEATCETAKCTNPVLKPEHKLCKPCWRKAHGYGSKAEDKEICQADGCSHPLLKSTHKLCKECWKRQHGYGEDNDAKCQKKGCNNLVLHPHHDICLSCWKKQFVSFQKIGVHFGVKLTRVNAILNELGWVKPLPHGNGFEITESGRSFKGKSGWDYRWGERVVYWPVDILNNKILCDAMSGYLGKNIPESPAPQEVADKAVDDFRNKYPAIFRATDGHLVRSKAEMLIDNFLYAAGVVHAYERKLPVEEDIYTDFYLLKGKVYIEYWGLDGKDPQYAARKRKKLAVYKKYGFDLIEIDEKKIQNLDDHLPRLLLPFGIEVD